VDRGRKNRLFFKGFFQANCPAGRRLGAERENTPKPSSCIISVCPIRAQVYSFCISHSDRASTQDNSSKRVMQSAPKPGLPSPGITGHITRSYSEYQGQDSLGLQRTGICKGPATGFLDGPA